MQRIFREKGEEILTTGEIISDLNENEEAPWADWDKGMTAKKLGGILKGFGVKSGRHRKDGDQKRGYALEELRPVFDRYLTTPPPESGPQSVSPTANQVPEPLSAVTDSKIDPSQRHIENSIRHTAEIVARRDAEAANQGTLAKLRREASITHPDCVLTNRFGAAAQKPLPSSTYSPLSSWSPWGLVSEAAVQPRLSRWSPMRYPQAHVRINR